MRLHNAKRSALLQLTNCMPSCNVETITELSDGKLFCKIIDNIFPEIEYDLLQEVQKVTKGPENEEICEDSKTESECAEGRSSLPDQIELNKLVVNDSESTSATAETAIESSDHIGREDETAFESTKSTRSRVKKKSDTFSETGCKSFSEPIKFSDSDDISRRYKLIQHFIDVRYNLKSETVISYSSCMNGDEFELAKVAIFILSEVIQHYVHVNNSVIYTLSLLDIKVQQDLEHCFSFFINERSDVTKEKVQKVLSNSAPYRSSGSPNKSYFVTPRRSCSSKYRKSTSPSEDSVYTDSPLKAYFESPIFTKTDIITKEKEISKIRKMLYEEETRSYQFQRQVEDLEKQLKAKDKELKECKSNLRRIQEEASSCSVQEEVEDIEHDYCLGCILLMGKIKEKDKEIEHWKSMTEKGEQDRIDTFNKMFLVKQEEYSRALATINYEMRKAEEAIRKAENDLEESERKLADKDEHLKSLEDENDTLAKQLELAKERLSNVEVKKDDESLEFGECMGAYMNEYDTSETRSKPQIKSESDEKIVKHVMVQCPDLSPDNSLHDQSITAEYSSANVLNDQDNASKLLSSLPSTEVSTAENIQTISSDDGIGSLWHMYNTSFSERDKADEATSMSTGIAKSNLPQLLLSIIRASSESNGSNGFSGSPIFKECFEEMKKCLSQKEESEAKCHNNSSVSKNIFVIDETKPTPVSTTSTKHAECLKEEIKMTKNNVASPKQEYYALLKEKDKELSSVTTILKEKEKELNNCSALLKEKELELDNLKEKYDKALKSLDDKKKDLECVRVKYYSFKNKVHMRLEKFIEMELKCQKFEKELIEIKKRENYVKRINIREKLLNKKLLEDLSNQNQQLEDSLVSNMVKVQKKVEELKIVKEKCEKLENEVSSHKQKNEMLSVLIGDLEKKLVDRDNTSKENLSDPTCTTLEDKAPSCSKGMSEESSPPEKSIQGPSKSELISPSVIDVTSADTCNESILSSALCSRSLHGTFHCIEDDEEAFLNYSSIADINKDYESEEVQSNIRMQELKRRNTMVPYHLQSCYPAEGVVMTPSEKLKRAKNKKSEAMKLYYQLGKNGQLGKKRKISETDSRNHLSKLSAGRMKIKKTVTVEEEITPSKVQFARFLHYNRKKRNFIKPEP